MSNLKGQILQNRYRIERELGRGGYGAVFLAEDRELQRPVAIKQLNEGLSPARFRREALAIAGLKHPHIVEIYDVFTAEGRLYQVMEYIEAGSLADLLKQPAAAKGLPVEEVVVIGKSLAMALQVIHQRHLVHRDIKPSNVLLSDTRDGLMVKLADFGVAHVPEAGTRLTHTGDILGTLPYLAPEQLKGQPAQAKSDVYALGILLYRLLTGRHYLPLEADSRENQRRILEEQPQPLTELRPDTPAWLSTLIHQALDKKPHRRPTALEFYRHLAAAGQARPRSRPARVRQAAVIQGIGAPVYSLRTLLVAILLTMLLAIAGTALALTEPGAQSILSETLAPVVVDIENPPVVSDAATGPAVNATPVVTAVVENVAEYDGLKLRQAPYLEAEVLAVLPEGVTLTVLGRVNRDGWQQVEAKQGTGWVYGSYLRVVDQP